jgi:two-component system LytT family response regulator
VTSTHSQVDVSLRQSDREVCPLHVHRAPLSAGIIGGELATRRLVAATIAAAGESLDIAGSGTGDQIPGDAMSVDDDLDLIFLNLLGDCRQAATLLEQFDPRCQVPFAVVAPHDGFARSAIDLGAVSYIVPPCEKGVRKAVNAAHEHRRIGTLKGIENTLNRLSGGNEHLPLAANPGQSRFIHRIAIREDDRMMLVRACDVDRFEGFGNYVKLHIRAATHRLRASLRELSVRLDPSQFARIHRSTIINVDRIREVQPWFGGDYVAILTDGARLRISRTYAPMLLRTFQ